MATETLVGVAVAVFGMGVTWCTWVSVSVFRQQQAIALIQKEIELLPGMSEMLDDIRLELRIKKRGQHHGG